MNARSSSRGARGGSGRRAVRTALLAGAAYLAPAGALSAVQDPAGVEPARAALEKWVEVRRLISQEQRDWELGREMLAERIALVQREIDALKARIGEAEASVSEVDRKRAELIERNEQLKEGSAALAGVAASLERRTRELLLRLPEPLRERVKPFSQQFPDDPAAAGLSLAKRFQNVVAVLNAVNKFHREITVTSEVRELSDGSLAEVTAFYLGISQGYYAAASGTAAGAGAAAADGWVWTPADQAAVEIAAAIAMLKGEKVAGFVRLPIRIE